MITGNWIEKDGVRIAMPASISIQTNSPLSDKTYVFFSGNKISKRGDNTYPFTVTLSEQDLSALGSPHIIQRLVQGSRITGWSLYSDGTLVGTFSILCTDITRDLNGSGAIVEMLLYNPVSDFVNAISAKKVNDLLMDGVRVIDQATNYLTGPTLPGVAYVNVNNAPVDTFREGSEAYPSISTPTGGLDLRGSATADYAAQITLNGDPHEMICFPTMYIVDDSNGNGWLNYWDPLGGNNYYPCYAYTPDVSLTGLQNAFSKYAVTDMGNHIVPMYYYHQVIRHCFSEFGYVLRDESGILDDPHFRRLVLVNNFDIINAMTVSLKNSDATNTRSVGYYQRTTAIIPKNHLPSDTIQDFLNDVMVKFNCYFEFNGQYVTIRFGDFNNISRELQAYSSKYKESRTLDTGVTIAYDFPSDKQYDSIKKVGEIMDAAQTEKVFAGGFNTVYPVATITDTPAPYPSDEYFAILAVDTNRLAFTIAGTGLNFFTNNLIPLTLGSDNVRSDSPSVNTNLPNQQNTSSFNLKYPPVGNMSPVVPGGYPGVRYILNEDQYTGHSQDDILAGTGGFSFNIEKDLFFVFGDSVIITGYLSGSPLVAGPKTGTVSSYVPSSGRIVVNILTDPIGFSFNNWVVTKDDLRNKYVMCPIMEAAISNAQPQDMLYQQNIPAGSTSTLYDPVGDDFSEDGAWIYVLALDNVGVSIPYLPGNWITRKNDTIIESGFFWGLYETTDLVGTGDSIPVLTGYQSIYKNTSVDPGWFNLSLQGPVNLVQVFWKGFINQFINNRKFTITVYEPVSDTRRHKFNNAVLWRGIRLYVSEQNADIPYQGKGVTYVCYQI